MKQIEHSGQNLSHYRKPDFRHLLILIALVMITAGIIIGLLSKLTRTENALLAEMEQQQGNWIGNSFINISEGGFVISVENDLYYTNPNDDYKVYRTGRNLGEGVKLCDIGAFYLNYRDGKLFFAQATGERYLYSMDLDGSGLTQLNDQATYEPKVIGDYIYYDDVDDHYSLWRCRLDGSEKEYLSDGMVYYSCFTDQEIYYLDPSDDYHCYVMDLDGSNQRQLLEGSYRELCLEDGMLYLSNNKTGITVYRLEDGETWAIAEAHSVRSMNVCDDWIYFASEDNQKHLFRIRIDGEKEAELSSVPAGFINVIESGRLVSYLNTDSSIEFFWYDAEDGETTPVR